jgi:hypothetical protein
MVAALNQRPFPFRESGESSPISEFQGECCRIIIILSMIRKCHGMEGPGQTADGQHQFPVGRWGARP